MFLLTLMLMADGKLYCLHLNLSVHFRSRISLLDLGALLHLEKALHNNSQQQFPALTCLLFVTKSSTLDVAQGLNIVTMALSMVDYPPPPLKFFCTPIQSCPPNIVFRKKCPTKSNADFV